MDKGLPVIEDTLENRLLVKCSRVLRNSNETHSIARILDHPINWDYFLAVAARNAVLPLVAKNLLNSQSIKLPPSIKVYCGEFLSSHLQRNMFLTSKLLELVRLFEASNVPILPFKGPLLAAQAYGDLSSRQYVDLDILVQPEKMEAAINLLLEGGYIPVSDISWINRSNWHLRDKKDIYFRSESGLVNVELHWKLSGSHFDLPFEMEGLWARLEQFSLADVSVRTLPFDDLLIYLCLHGSRHGWERFGWICDVNELIRSRETIEWEPVVTKARILGCENVLNLGLFLVHEFFGNEFSYAGWRKVANDLMFLTCAKRIRAQLFNEQYTVMKIGDRYAYHLKLKEDRRDRWKLHLHYVARYAKLIFTPRATDTNMFRLPRALEPLYYVMRPLRLFYNYALRSKKTSA